MQSCSVSVLIRWGQPSLGFLPCCMSLPQEVGGHSPHPSGFAKFGLRRSHGTPEYLVPGLTAASLFCDLRARPLSSLGLSILSEKWEMSWLGPNLWFFWSCWGSCTGKDLCWPGSWRALAQEKLHSTSTTRQGPWLSQPITSQVLLGLWFEGGVLPGSCWFHGGAEFPAFSPRLQHQLSPKCLACRPVLQVDLPDPRNHVSQFLKMIYW